MEPGFIWWLFFHITSPFLFIKHFFHYTYSIFFLVNIFLLCFYFIRNRNLRKEGIRLLPKKRYLAAFLAILALVLVNLVYCMQPMNNIIPTTTEEIYQANQFLSRLHLLNFERPHGFTLVLAFSRFITQMDYPYLLALLGITIALATMLLIYMVLQKLTDNGILALLACFWYGIHSITVQYNTTRVSSLSLSSLSLCFLAYLYVTDKNGSNLMLILCASTFAVFMRLENIMVIMAFAIYAIVIYMKHRNFSIPKAIGLIYLLIVPQSYALFNYKPYLNDVSQEYIIGTGGTMHRLSTFIAILADNIGVLGMLLLMLGVIYTVQKGTWMLASGATLITYMLLQLYPGFLEKYLLNLFPLLIILVACGVSYLFSRSLAPFLLLAVVLITPFHLFSTLPYDGMYILPCMELASEADGEVVVFGYRDLVFSFQRFFPGSYAANDIIEEFDEEPVLHNPKYLIHLSEIGSSEEYIEQRLPLQVEFIKKQGVASLYLVK
jgi:hypothetical protein